MEAIEHQTAPWAVGVLWHPERSHETGLADDPLIADFVAAAGGTSA